MYAVIRAGGKQYRVAPGDVVRVESQGTAKDNQIEFEQVLAVSPADGQILRPQPGALVRGEVLGEGRGRKVLVFHYKRKKQYKKVFGHRQPFTSVRITEIAFDGQKFTAPAVAKKEGKSGTPASAAQQKAQVEAKAAEPAKKSTGARTKAPAKKTSAQKKK
jgi:large subunit ribosomal protein L21